MRDRHNYSIKYKNLSLNSIRKKYLNNKKEEELIDDNKIKDINFKGFYNFGNTCYMNSFLQIFIHIPGLIEKLKKKLKIVPCDTLLFHLLNVVDCPSIENLHFLREAFIKSNSNYNYFRQEDSQEFGSEFIKKINNEVPIFKRWDLEGFIPIKKRNNLQEKKLNKLINLIKDEDSDINDVTIINDLFYFYESELIICNNRVALVNYSGDIDVQLSFNLNNYDKKMNTINLIDLMKNKYLKGKKKLIKLPKILMITLLRAIIGEPLIKTKVLFDKEINLKEFIDKDFGDYSLCTKYSLFALNVCFGNSKKYGHYYSYILLNKDWYKFDDLKVTKVNNENTIKGDLSYIYGIYFINNEYLNSLK